MAAYNGYEVYLEAGNWDSHKIEIKLLELSVVVEIDIMLSYLWTCEQSYLTIV